jgi:Cu-processing system permease protein
VARNTLREILRERVLNSLLIFVVVMLVAALIGEQLSIRQQGKIIKDMGLAAIEVFGTLLAAFLGVSLISRELERRSLYVVLSKSVSRTEFLFGKVAGLALALAFTVTLMTLVMYASLALSQVAFDARLLRAVYGLYVGMLLVEAIAVASASFTSSTMATMWVIALVVAGRYADVVRNMQGVGIAVPSWLTTGLYYALPNFRNFDLKDRVVYGDPVGVAILANLTAYGLAYSAVLLALAVWNFKRRDLP